MTYIDAYVAAVPTANRAAYLEHTTQVGPVFKEHGALSITECWGDDIPDGEVTSFPLAVKCAADETVVLGWVVWPSKEVRDRGMAAMMEDSRMSPENAPMPFDGKRLIYGGFDLLLEQ